MYALNKRVVCRSVLLSRKLFSDSKTGFGQKIGSIMERTKGTIFELMARNMSDKDVKKFMNHWTPHIESHSTESVVISKSTQESNSKPAPSKANTATTQSDGLFDADFIEKILNKKDTELYHPLLGELLMDVGYKKVYLTNVHSLARTPVWKRQRILRPERAAIIAEEKIRRGLQGSVAGMISMYQDETSRDVGIIDGQHRAGALMVLCQRGYWNEYQHNVMIEVFPTVNEQHIAKLFREINAAEPVRMIDLPEELLQEERLLQMQLEDEELDEQPVVEETVIVPPFSVPSSSPPIPRPVITSTATEVTVSPPSTTTTTATPSAVPENASTSTTVKNTRNKKSSSATPSTTDDNAETASATTTATVNIRDIITDSVDHFRQKAPEMFKPTARCKVPHVNVDVLRDDLYNSPLFMASSSAGTKAKTIKQTTDLVTLLEEKNDQLAKKYISLLDHPEELALYNKSFKAAILKAQQHHFFLGMDKQWLENL